MIEGKFCTQHHRSKADSRKMQLGCNTKVETSVIQTVYDPLTNKDTQKDNCTAW